MKSFKTGKDVQCSNGFTLVEIMIVVGILAILAALVIPNLVRGRMTANDASAKATLKSISSAMENYMAIEGEYPSDTDDLIGETPPYLNSNYFTGTHNGFTFTADSLGSGGYTVYAAPLTANQGSGSFSVSTGGVIEEY